MKDNDVSITKKAFGTLETGPALVVRNRCRGLFGLVHCRTVVLCLDQFSAPEVMTLAHDFKAVAAPDDRLFVKRIAFRKRLWNCMGCRDRWQHMETLLMADLPLGFPNTSLLGDSLLQMRMRRAPARLSSPLPGIAPSILLMLFFKNSPRSPINMA